jgi:hypothetical protein
VARGSTAAGHPKFISWNLARVSDRASAGVEKFHIAEQLRAYDLVDLRNAMLTRH